MYLVILFHQRNLLLSIIYARFVMHKLILSDIFDTCKFFFHLSFHFTQYAEKRSREPLHNHAIILMLLVAFIYQLIDISLHLQFFSTDTIRPDTPALYLVWWYIDWCFFFSHCQFTYICAISTTYSHLSFSLGCHKNVGFFTTFHY
jgi:hypothetical protein